MFNQKFIINLVFFKFFFLSLGVFGQNSKMSRNFSFTLKEQSTTSAGVFNSEATLVRTIWGNKPFSTGTHIAVWDGLLDDGTEAAAGTYQIKVLSNNIQYEWEGARIGNTSDSLTGAAKWRGFQGLYDMAVHGNNAYFCLNYSEGWNSNYKVNLLAPQSKLELNKGGWGQATQFVATDGTIVYWAGGDPTNGSRSFVFGTNVSNDLITAFSGGSLMTFSHSKSYSHAIDKVEISNGHVTGLAVQKAGNYLFSAHGRLNRIHVFNKTTGALVHINTSLTNPRSLCVDG